MGEHTLTKTKERIIPYNVMTPIYDFKTTNKSFIEVHEQLKLLGIKNNAFHLILLNPALQGVDPHDPNLTKQQIVMIIQECKLNMYYYLREVVLIEEQGGGLVKFRMDRGTLAASYNFINNINFYLMKPRQTGKTVGINAMLSWAFKFQGPNGDFLFSCYKDDLAKKNLRGMRTIINHLPSYMVKMGTTTKDSNGKTIRKTDNIKTYREPAQNNSAMVANCASSEDAAETVGRGFTHIYQFFDEAEFTKYIGIIVKVSGMAYNTAASNAEKNNSGHCRIFATTPGDLGNKKACQSAMEIVNDAVVWDEKFYDIHIREYRAIIYKKSVFRVAYIEYDYKQLGLGEEWFIDACSNVGGDIAKIKREILLQRFSGNSDSPFTPDEIDEIDANQLTPIAVKTVYRIYDILFYEKPKKNRLYFIGIDPSEGTGGDNYAITVIDPYELNVVAEFKSAYMTIDGCVDLVTWLCDNYFNNPLLIIERNRNGGALIEQMKKSKYRNHIYTTPEANGDKSLISDKLDPNGFIKEEFVRNKFFGTNTTATTRQLMMNILLDIMHFSRQLVRSKYIVADIKNLVIKNDKIQAAAGEHDDSVMSWLIALYVLYYGQKLERYGFHKGQLPQDIQEDSEFIQLQKLYKNPEIRKQFPTMYSYYLAEMEKKYQIEQYEKEVNDPEPDKYKIGGVNTSDTTFDPVIDDAPTTVFDYNSEKNKNHTTESLIRRFMSLNKQGWGL